jgi:GR25 family glycosyltransferase involved in LPS biosynthesis
MARIRGYVINLLEAAERRGRMAQQLTDLELLPHYRLFEAKRGSSSEESRRGLSQGEDGLWRSVLALLRSAPLDEADYLHILEDDAVLTQAFCNWITKLSRDSPKHQIWFTDMYAGASVYPSLYALVKKTRANEAQAWMGGKGYTGCTSSWLIHRDHIQKVHNELAYAYNNLEKRIPIDNLLRRLLQEGKLTAQISIPFLTSIHLDEQQQSSIQTQETIAVQATRVFGAILRRRLSHAQSPEDARLLGPTLAQLLPEEEINEWLAQDLIDNLKQRKALRYRYDPRLLEEKGNPQALRGERQD